MSTQSMTIQSGDRLPESAARRIRVRRRSAAALAPAHDHAAVPAAAQDHAAAPVAASPARPDATRQGGGVGGARILRRWSVADLIARAGGAPRAFA
jgi:hypothetical protein